MFGELSAEAVLTNGGDDRVSYLLRLSYERACRAVSEGRVQSHSDYDRLLGPSWRALLAVNEVEVTAGDGGFADVLDEMSHEDLVLAADFYVRQALHRKAECVRAALEIEAAGPPGEGGGLPPEADSPRLRQLSDQFLDSEEDAYKALEDDIRAHPREYALPAFGGEFDLGGATPNEQRSR